jgi:hypothetical protein
MTKLRVFAALLVFLEALTPACAQTRVGNTTHLTMQEPAEQSATSVIRGAFGKPCLDVEAAARPHIVNPDTIDHVVSIKNNCPRTIKVKVCYVNSAKCNAFDVQGYSRVDTTLGTMMKIKVFRYSLTQK